MKWISVKKKLPPLCETVVLTNAPARALWDDSVVWTGFYGGDKWFTSCGGNFMGAAPTFWCSLPSTKQKL